MFHRNLRDETFFENKNAPCGFLKKGMRPTNDSLARSRGGNGL
jgi:hypothetical protein